MRFIRAALHTRTIRSTPGDNINGDTFACGATAKCAAAADDNAVGGSGIEIGKLDFASDTDPAAAAAADDEADAIDDNAAAATARAGVSGLLTVALSRSAAAAATVAAATAAAADCLVLASTAFR